MDSRSDILNELEALSPMLAKIGNANVFSVPEGYFDHLSETILVCIHEENSSVAKMNAADVPENYFDGLADNILLKIKMQEESAAELPAVLQSIRHKNVFEVPQGYFDTLAFDVINNIKTQQPAKVVSFGSRIVKYAAAAMITGAIALGAYQYSNNNGQTDITTAAFAQIDQAIEKGKNMDEKQFNSTLDSLSTEDIAKYLELNVDENDLEALAANIDESSLPTEDEYITDDKTLENYLTEIDTEEFNN
ncbi:MAG: hypothetical protein V4556_03385 [Bacteroidota bacterium]